MLLVAILFYVAFLRKEEYYDDSCKANSECTNCVFSLMPGNFGSYGNQYFCGQGSRGYNSCQRTYTAKNGTGF